MLPAILDFWNCCGSPLKISQLDMYYINGSGQAKCYLSNFVCVRDGLWDRVSARVSKLNTRCHIALRWPLNTYVFMFLGALVDNYEASRQCLDKSVYESQELLMGRYMNRVPGTLNVLCPQSKWE